jgi:uncharacterized protein (DUF1778 family)
MPDAQTQISAYVSESTKELVEQYADAHGVKKGHLIEEALLHHMQALRELPADLIIPPRLVVREASAARVLESVQKPRRPTRAMSALFRKREKRSKPCEAREQERDSQGGGEAGRREKKRKRESI